MAINPNEPNQEQLSSVRDWYDPSVHAPVHIGEINSLEHTARVLGISPLTLRRYVQQGEIPCSRFGRQTLFTRDDVLRFVAMHAQPATLGIA